MLGCTYLLKWNKAKRRLRHALQESVKTRQSLPTVALALIAKKESLNASFIDLKSLIEAVLHRLVLKQDEA